jgi:hypothetical protein
MLIESARKTEKSDPRQIVLTLALILNENHRVSVLKVTVYNYQA